MSPLLARSHGGTPGVGGEDDPGRRTASHSGAVIPLHNRTTRLTVLVWSCSHTFA